MSRTELRPLKLLNFPGGKGILLRRPVERDAHVLAIVHDTVAPPRPTAGSRPFGVRPDGPRQRRCGVADESGESPSGIDLTELAGILSRREEDP